MTQLSHGFCVKCGFFREDAVLPSGKRVPILDCPCTAKLWHKETCFYVRCCGSHVDTGIYCKQHGQHACPTCDCTCEGPDATTIAEDK